MAVRLPMALAHFDIILSDGLRGMAQRYYNYARACAAITIQYCTIGRSGVTAGFKLRYIISLPQSKIVYMIPGVVSLRKNKDKGNLWLERKRNCSMATKHPLGMTEVFCRYQISQRQKNESLFGIRVQIVITADSNTRSEWLSTCLRRVDVSSPASG